MAKFRPEQNVGRLSRKTEQQVHPAGPRVVGTRLGALAPAVRAARAVLVMGLVPARALVLPVR